jgi:hypothetical protein
MKSKGKKKPGRSAALAWYSETGWKQIRQAAEDPDRLESSYGKWKGLFEQTKQMFEKIGVPYRVIEIDADELLAWCNENELPVNERSRIDFTSIKHQEAGLEG